MTSRRRGRPPGVGPDRSGAAPGPDAPPVELRCRVVEYDDRPDRCTVHPPESAGRPRTTTWLSADRSVLVDLTAVR